MHLSRMTLFHSYEFGVVKRARNTCYGKMVSFTTNLKGSNEYGPSMKSDP